MNLLERILFIQLQSDVFDINAIKDVFFDKLHMNT